MSAPPTTPVIGFEGRKRAGKDALCALMTRGRDAVVINFSDPIIAEAEAELGDGTRITPENKGRYRTFLQAVGDRRRAEDPCYWIARVATRLERAKAEGHELICLVGARAADERAFCDRVADVVVEVHRPQARAIPAPLRPLLDRLPARILRRALPASWRAELHPLERLRGTGPRRIIDNSGTLDDLAVAAAEIASDLGLGTRD